MYIKHKHIFVFMCLKYNTYMQSFYQFYGSLAGLIFFLLGHLQYNKLINTRENYYSTNRYE